MLKSNLFRTRTKYERSAQRIGEQKRFARAAETLKIKVSSFIFFISKYYIRIWYCGKYTTFFEKGTILNLRSLFEYHMVRPLLQPENTLPDPIRKSAPELEMSVDFLTIFLLRN